MIQPALYRILTHGVQHDLATYLDLAAQYGSPILDLGAGLGRIGHALLMDGHAVVMLEKEPAYCEELHHLRQHLPPEVMQQSWICQSDFTTPDWFSERNHISGDKERQPSKFGLIILGLRTIHLLRPEEQSALLHQAVQHLHPKGALVIHHTEIPKTKADAIWRLAAEHTTEDGFLEIDECLQWHPMAGQFGLRHRIKQYTGLGQQVAQWRVAHNLHPIAMLDLQQMLAEAGCMSINFRALPDHDRLAIATLTAGQ